MVKLIFFFQDLERSVIGSTQKMNNGKAEFFLEINKR